MNGLKDIKFVTNQQTGKRTVYIPHGMSNTKAKNLIKKARLSGKPNKAV